MADCFTHVSNSRTLWEYTFTTKGTDFIESFSDTDSKVAKIIKKK